MKEGLKMASFKFDSKKFMRELEKDGAIPNSV